MDERIAFLEFVNRPGPEDYLRRLETSDHESEEHLREILQSLGESEHKPAIPHLTKLWLEHPRLPIRQAAGQALLCIGSPDALEALLRRTGDSDPLCAALAVLAVFVQDPRTAFDRLPPDRCTLQCLRLELWPKDLEPYLRNKLILEHESFNWFQLDPRWFDLCRALRDDDLLGPIAQRIC